MSIHKLIARDVHRALYIYNDPEHMQAMKNLTIKSIISRGVAYRESARRITLDEYIIDFSYIGDDLTALRYNHYDKVIAFGNVSPQDREFINILLAHRGGKFQKAGSI